MRRVVEVPDFAFALFMATFKGYMKKRCFMKRWIIVCLLCLLAGYMHAQSKWYNPRQAGVRVVNGQGWYEELAGGYNRLPERIREKIRPSLWNLSTHSAGLSLVFRTNAPELTVRYGISGAEDMSHMPATGVSGVDLYVKNEDDGQWHSEYVAKATFDFKGNLYFADTNNRPTRLYVYRPESGERRIVNDFSKIRNWG